ncbi:hypothetical protein C0995_004104 [Termitomyces sp. Mi166|nr:hypothetical protein C0995_004104 [Termitomyces sp. Mi166\
MLITSTLLTLPFALIVHAQSDGLQVSTTQGPVIGTLVSPTVRQFLGIPYATARRWEAPTPPPSRSSPFHATNFSDTCPQALSSASASFLQLLGIDNSTIFVPESEECLTVNIWAPSISRKQHTAILLIHSCIVSEPKVVQSNFPIYNGKNIVRDNDDILVVSFNYRLNIFGFPNAPQLVSNEAKSQNFGFLDLDAVVQWVYDNIAAFGGDPERITLFGQSAGGIAIDAYTFAHPQDTRVLSSSLERANLHVELSVFPEPTSPSWAIVASAVGCSNVTDDVQLTCMKQVPFRQLEDAVIGAGINFLPLSDGITFFSDTPTRAATGNLPTCTTPRWVNSERGRLHWSHRRDNHGSAVFSDISPRPDLRAYHTSELPVVFGTFTSPTGPEKALSKFVQSAWVAFARDPAHGLLNLGWPQYSPNTTTLAQIGGFLNQTGISFSEGRLLDFACNSSETLDTVVAQLTALLGPAGIGFGF